MTAADGNHPSPQSTNAAPDKPIHNQLAPMYVCMCVFMHLYALFEHQNIACKQHYNSCEPAFPITAFDCGLPGAAQFHTNHITIIVELSLKHIHT